MADLLATCWTTAGNAYPVTGHDKSPHSLEERVEGASQAGYRGIGIMHVDLAAYLETHTLPQLRDLLKKHEMRHVELEFLTNWWLEPIPEPDDSILHLLLESALALGPHHVKIGPDITGTLQVTEQWSESLHRIGRLFADVGTPVAIEFMPFSNIPTLNDALALVEAADHDALGVMVDSWHIELGSTDFTDISTLAAEVIKGVEINDGRRGGSNDYEATISARELCGQGDFDLASFIQAVTDTGWSGPWGVEILSESFREKPIEEACELSFQTASQVLKRSAVA